MITLASFRLYSYRLYFIILINALISSVSCLADDSVVNKKDIIEALSEPTTRGIRIAPKKTLPNKATQDSEQTTRLEPTHDTALSTEYGLVVLDIKFEFNSSKLSTSAISQLTELGQALTSNELSSGSFEISGHTDSSGSAAYNKNLSLKRAISVEQYLLNEFNIDRAKLTAHGHGEEKPLFATDPANGANRRVEIRRIK